MMAVLDKSDFDECRLWPYMFGAMTLSWKEKLAKIASRLPISGGYLKLLINCALELKGF